MEEQTMCLPILSILKTKKEDLRRAEAENEYAISFIA
jgi:hypothetical protein